MSAIITSKFRIHNAASFKEGFSESSPSNMYLFIGRPYRWEQNIGTETAPQWIDDDTAPYTPYDTVHTEFDIWKDMIAMKRINSTDVTHAIMRRDWTSGQHYDMYRDNYNGIGAQGVYTGGAGQAVTTTRETLFDASFFVMNTNYQVFKCLNNVDKTTGEIVPSTVMPDGTNSYAPFTTSDGYTWKFMFQISAADVLKFVTADFIPVKLATSDNINDPYYSQWLAQSNAIDGAIEHISVTSGGNYVGGSDPTIEIVGDGTGCTAEVVRTGSVITGVNITNRGQGYTYATAVISNNGGGTGGGVLHCQISPKGGHGYNAIEELGGFYVTMNVRLSYAEGAGNTDGTTDFPIDNDYRRIGIIKDPYNYNTTDICTDSTRIATFSLSLQGTDEFHFDELITQPSNGARGYVVSWDSDNRILHYISTFNDPNRTGDPDKDPVESIIFQSGELIEGEYGNSAVIDEIGIPEVQPYSGDMIYFENRRPISRADDQIEDIKIIVEM